MAFTVPYKQHNYMGEYANDAACLTFIQANAWDSAGNGTGNPQNGMWYYNTTDHKPRMYLNSAWCYFATLTTVTNVLNMGGAKITNVGTPTAGTDAANKDYVDQFAGGVEWQDSVISKTLSVPPLTPTNGDRYITASAGNQAITNVNQGTKTFTVGVDITANVAAGDSIRIVGSTGNDGAYTVVSSTFGGGVTDVVVTEAIPSAVVDGALHWTGAGWNTKGPYNIVQYVVSTLSWTRWVAVEGYAAWVDAEDTAWIFNGSIWVKFAGVFNHNDLANIDGGQASPAQYYHMKSAEHVAITGSGGVVDASSYHNHSTLYGKVQTGVVNPNGTVTGIAGGVYIDTLHEKVYINVGSASNTNKWDVV